MTDEERKQLAKHRRKEIESALLESKYGGALFDTILEAIILFKIFR